MYVNPCKQRRTGFSVGTPRNWCNAISQNQVIYSYSDGHNHPYRAGSYGHSLTNKGPWDKSNEFALFSRWSPDGKQIVYDWCNENEFADLCIIGLDGSNPRILYSNEEVVWLQTYDWSPDGRQILARFSRKDETQQIVLVSAADGSVCVLKTLDNYYPGNMSFSPDGHYIVYAHPQKEDSQDYDIFVMSIDGSREIPLVEHPAHDFVLGLAPDGKNILFASDRTGTLGVWLIAVADGKPQGAPELVKPVIGRFEPLGFTREGSFYYGISKASDDVYIATLDPETGKILVPPKKAIKRFEGSNIASGYSPDGKYLAYIYKLGFVSSHRSHRNILCIRSLETGKEREFSLNLNRITRYCSPRWFPDCRSLLVRGRDNNNFITYLIDVQTGDVKPIVLRDDGTSFRSCEWSRDGKAIFYVRRNNNDLCQILVRDLETGKEKELYRSSSDEYFNNISLSPDGQWLALLSVLSSLKVLPVTGGEPRELCRFEGRLDMSITWTADGKYILFAGERSGEQLQELYRIPAEGGEIEKLGLKMNQFFTLSAHPDGQHLAFSSGGPAAIIHEVWVMENFLPEAPVAKPASATTLRMVTDRWKRGYASVSPDGKYMTELDLDTDDLVVREIATGKKRRLTNKGSGKDCLALDSLISPDGKKVAYFWDGPRGEATGLCIIGLDGSGRRLLRRNEYLVPRDWSADGKRILGILFGEDETNKMVWVSTSDGSIEQIKLVGKAYPEKFDISPDGRFIAYDRPQAESTSKRDIFLFDIEQARERRLVGHLDDDKLLGWTPDGKSIFFASDRGLRIISKTSKKVYTNGIIVG